MEARHGTILTESPNEAAVRTEVTERLVDDLKAVIQRAQEKAVEHAKAADKVIRETSISDHWPCLWPRPAHRHPRPAQVGSHDANGLIGGFSRRAGLASR